ncbi:MAG TPA: N-acetylneuraminate synthase family protein [Candidatus Paceibacterota bacterium]
MAKIIVELCQNHNGSRDVLRKMIGAAAENGADIVKIQSIWSSDLTERPQFEEGEVDGRTGICTAIKRPYAAEVERLSKLDLTLEDHRIFADTCQEFGVTAMTTVFARHRIRQVASIPALRGVVKVASYDCASYPMLRELAQHFEHFIISTGATYDEEIKQAAELMKSLGKRFAFLHCVTSYPNALHDCNLARMEWLRQFTPEVGWSDHTKVKESGLVAAKAALALGAQYVERHFTILDEDKTKDGPVSITPAMLKELSDFRRLSSDEQMQELDKRHPGWRIAIGVPERQLGHTELLNRDYYRGRFASPKKDGGWLYNWEPN